MFFPPGCLENMNLVLSGLMARPAHMSQSRQMAKWALSSVVTSFHVSVHMKMTPSSMYIPSEELYILPCS